MADETPIENVPAEEPRAAAPSAPPPSGPPPAGRGGAPGERPRRRFPRRKVCYFRTIKADFIDFKDVNTLRRFVSDQGKILPRRVTGTSAKYQRLLTTAIKRARFMALLPFTARHR